jgi:DNA-directed RNA polymerase specialized sigma24 family protein
MLSGSARPRRDDPGCCVVVSDIAKRRPDPADDVLAPAAAQGHRLAQRELFRRLAPQVHQALHTVLGNSDQIELHLQDAFVEIFRSLRNYNHEPDLVTWACAIAVRSTRRRAAGRPLG